MVRAWSFNGHLNAGKNIGIREKRIYLLPFPDAVDMALSRECRSKN